jgi:lipoprotein-releasing system permease protein
MALLQSEEKMAFPYLHGIDADREAAVVPMGKFLVSGRLDELDDDSVLLSSGLADRLDVRLGESVDFFAPRSLRAGHTREISLPRSLRVVGIFQTRWDQIDGNTAICTNRFLQDVFGLGAGVSGIALRLRPEVEPDAIAARLNQLLPASVRAISWQDSNRDFLYVMQLEKNVMFFLLFFIEIVAAFALAASLLILVTRRTREIGLLAALGARPREVAGIFCLQGLLIGVMGTTLGLLGAVVALHYRQGLLQAMVRVLQSEAALARFRQFQDIPASCSARDFGVVILSSLLVCTLAGLLPAWRAARLKPAQALRSE